MGVLNKLRKALEFILVIFILVSITALPLLVIAFNKMDSNSSFVGHLYHYITEFRTLFPVITEAADGYLLIAYLSGVLGLFSATLVKVVFGIAYKSYPERNNDQFSEVVKTSRAYQNYLKKVFNSLIDNDSSSDEVSSDVKKGVIFEITIHFCALIMQAVPFFGFFLGQAILSEDQSPVYMILIVLLALMIVTGWFAVNTANECKKYLFPTWNYSKRLNEIFPTIGSILYLWFPPLNSCITIGRISIFIVSAVAVTYH